MREQMTLKRTLMLPVDAALCENTFTSEEDLFWSRVDLATELAFRLHEIEVAKAVLKDAAFWDVMLELMQLAEGMYVARLTPMEQAPWVCLHLGGDAFQHLNGDNALQYLNRFRRIFCLAELEMDTVETRRLKGRKGILEDEIAKMAVEHQPKKKEKGASCPPESRL